MDHVIKMFFDYMKIVNSPLCLLLQDGLSPIEIDQMLGGLDINLPEDIYRFYAFHNGLKEISGFSIGQMTLFNKGIFMSFEKCLAEYQYLKNDRLLKKKLPIFDSGAGDFLLIDCDENSETYNRFLIYAPDLLILKPIAIYDSLNTLLLSVIRCFAEGIYYFDDDGFLEIDFDQERFVCGQLNPLSKFWSL